MSDQETIKALHKTLVELLGQGRGVTGLFTKDPNTLLESVATLEGGVSTEVWFVNSYPEFLIGTNPHRTSEHGTWHLRETTKIYNELGNQIVGYKIMYDYRRKNNGGGQGPTLGLREYTYNPRGLNEHSLCVIYEKRPKRKSNRNGEGVDQVQYERDHEEAPVLLQIAGAANPNYAGTGPSTAPLEPSEVVHIFVVAPAFPAEPAIKSSEEIEEARDPDDDASKLGWFYFGDMSTYDSGSLDFIEGGCEQNEQSPLCIINEKQPKKKPIRSREGVLQMASANPNYAAAAAPEGWDFSKYVFRDMIS